MRDEITLRFRVSGKQGYGASPLMVRRCFERMDGDRIAGRIRVLYGLSDRWIKQQAIVDYQGNCGNISLGVGPFAVDEQLVSAVEPVTRVRIFNTNTKKILEAEVPVKNGRAISEGDFAVEGVPGSGARIVVNFVNSAGSKTGKLLPTGNVVDVMELDNGKSVRCSLVDAAAPAVFVQAKDIGLTGTELPSDTQSNPRILGLMEEIRAKAAVMMKLAPNRYEVQSGYSKGCDRGAASGLPNKFRKSHHRRRV